MTAWKILRQLTAALTAVCLWTGVAGAQAEGFGAELGTYVKDGVVDYRAWSMDHKGLDSFLASLAHTDPGALPANEAKALLINAYNAFMIRLIIVHSPIKGVFDIEPKVFGQKKLNLGGMMVSLDEIENTYLRKMGDPRIHFAIVCGSKGCPDLASRAYTADTLDAQLDDAARRYLSQPKGLILVKDPPTVRLSRIFEWFGKDFGETEQERLAALAMYLPDEQRALLSAQGSTVKVEYLEYDWSLNGR